MRYWPCIALALAVVGACGDDGSPPPADGGPEQNRLEVLDPPGDAIGLPFGASTTLRVRYSNGNDEPIADARIEFSILAGASEAVGGSALSATDALTDSDGIATVDLVAGAQGAGFRVRAEVPGSAQATFFVSVSDQGFTRLLVLPVHDGPRPELEFTQIDVRVYRPQELRCPGADPDALPESLFPPRVLPAFGERAEIPNLISGAGYTVVSWTTIAPSTTPLSFGCAELSAEQSRNFDVEVPLTTTDRPVRMDAPLALSSDLDLSLLVADSPAAQAPWATLACPLGAGQLAVDCVADALLAAGPLDCDFSSASGALADAVRAERGDADGDGCRPADKNGGGDSLDKLVDDAIAAGGSFPTGSELAAVVAVRDAIASSLTVRSELRVAATAEHRLVEAEVGPGYVVDLVASARLVIERQGIAATVTPAGAAAPVAELETHDFTFDYGAIARDGFQALALDDHGLGGQTLGSELFGSVMSGGDSGCTALSEVFCGAVGEPDSCASAACASAESYLDDALREWWLRTRPGGLDLSLSATVELRDSDNDLLVDQLGRDAAGAITGLVSATLTTTAGAVTDLPGTAASPQP
ncbi:MAG: Ig-like domain-containing protein [Deltaproteobacteria bacterium]|nr:Ig-like domain-containing protein [Deltaproteobacteria bacterium]